MRASTLAPVRSFFGHPPGLATLFFTELWERFSYYGMRALLILFMTAAAADGGLGFDAEKAGAVYGLYTAAVYLTALPGGWVADRLIGRRRAVLYGGIIIAAGHFSMAIPTVGTFYLGLCLIAAGTGLLKPNVSAMVGELYPEGGARRDAGFSIFYMGINIGAFAAPLIVGWLGERVDWHVGFGAAGVGMVLGLVQYVAGGRHLADALARPKGEVERRPAGRRAPWLVGGAAVVALLGGLQLAGAFELETAKGLSTAAGVLILAVVVVYFATSLIGGGLEPNERKRVAVVFVLFVFSCMFWSGFEQAGSSLNLFARELTDRAIGRWEIPASWLQSVNALMIIFLAPVFAWLWRWLDRRRLEPSSPAKFALGLALLGAGFLVMVAASALSRAGKVSPMWLVMTYLFHTLGELSLSPVGLSTVTKLAPQRMVGQMMGIWFMSISLGNLIAGRVAGLYATLALPQLFGAVAATALVSALLLWAFVPLARRLLR